MHYRVSDLSSNLVFSCISSGQSEETLNLSIVQIVPIDRCKRYSCYMDGTIDIKNLTREKIKEIFRKHNCKSIPEILEDDDFFIFQYEKKSIILVSKKDGKFYARTKDKEMVSLQSHIVYDLLRREGYILNHHNRFHYNCLNVSFLEETEGREKKVEQSTIKNRSLFIFSNLIPSASKRKEEKKMLCEICGSTMIRSGTHTTNGITYQRYKCPDCNVFKFVEE